MLLDKTLPIKNIAEIAFSRTAPSCLGGVRGGK